MPPPPRRAAPPPAAAPAPFRATLIARAAFEPDPPRRHFFEHYTDAARGPLTYEFAPRAPVAVERAAARGSPPGSPPGSSRRSPCAAAAGAGASPFAASLAASARAPAALPGSPPLARTAIITGLCDADIAARLGFDGLGDTDAAGARGGSEGGGGGSDGYGGGAGAAAGASPPSARDETGAAEASWSFTADGAACRVWRPSTARFRTFSAIGPLASLARIFGPAHVSAARAS